MRLARRKVAVGLYWRRLGIIVFARYPGGSRVLERLEIHNRRRMAFGERFIPLSHELSIVESTSIT